MTPTNIPTTPPADPAEETIDQHTGAGRALRHIGKSTTVSIALVLSVMSASYKAGQMAHRIDTIEVDTGRTAQVLSQLQQLSEQMDRRLTRLEDRTFTAHAAP